MNDLKLLSAHSKNLNAGNSIEFISFDINMGTVYTSDHNKIYGIDTNNLDNVTVYDLTGENVSNSIDNRLVSMQFLTESNNISLINSKGDLFLLNVLTAEFEGVGTIPDGISAVQWSTDQELLVLLTDSNALILMTKDFDILAENPISIQNKVELEYVNVGWGSFETQFKGSDGKKFQKEKGEEKCLEWDLKKGSICWRSDGEYFVVSFVESNAHSRKFQIFTRDGVLHSTIENNVNILDAPITWKYSKSLLAASIYRLNKHEIIFFERNGLAHGSFQLPFPVNQMKVKGIYWNLDSSILCVWSERVNFTNDETYDCQSVVQLWTTANYHWYLKQSYNFNEANKITAVSWDQEDSYGLHLFTCIGKYIKYKLGTVTNFCTTDVSNYNASIAVTDNQNILITPFKKKIIPPPMSLHKLVCNSCVNNLAWSNCNMDLLALLANGDLAYFKYQTSLNERNVEKETYDLAGQLKLSIVDLNNYSGSVQQMVWINQTELLIIADIIGSGLNLIKLSLSLGENENQFQITEKSRFKLDFIVLNLSYNRNANRLAIQCIDGRVFKYDENLLVIDEFQFPQPCSTFQLIKTNDREVYVGATQYYRLYFNRTEVSNNCSSFYVHDEYLLFTDHSNSLKFVNLSKTKDEQSAKAQQVVQEEAVRSLERGARLVLSIHKDTTCILQMPRGNIEAIHPRTLLISKLKFDIDSLNYATVIETMRKHRINMNIVFDHNPDAFLAHLAEFVSKVDSPALLNLFLTELNDDDTTVTFYRDHYPQKKAPITKIDLNSNVTYVKFPDKLKRVCTGLINICEEVNAKKYYLTILSCHAKMKDLEKALYKICQLKETSNSTACIDEGLRHLLYIVDVNEMFDVALGTYDFEIVLMVAEKSQKDPKEYLPFLNDLKKLEENYMKYKIDFYLKRYRKALHSIVKCGETHHEEVVKLTDDHKLYSEALKYFTSDDDLFKRISKCYAAHLSTKKYYEEAGLILFRANLLSEALDTFFHSSNWEMYTNVCIKMKLSGSDLLDKLNKLVDKLKNENKLLECASIYENYLNDSESAIISLVDGCFWQEAITAVHKFDRFDFFETNLIPALKENQKDLIANIDQLKAKFIEKFERLEEVRIEKAKRKEREENEYEEELRNLNDDQSVSDMSNSTFDGQSSVSGSVRSNASTINSQFSSKSTKRRKQKRSLISLKKNSPFEDLALIQDLHETISYSQKIKDSVASLSKTLVLFNMGELCIGLQNCYENLMDMIEKNIGAIWNYDLNNSDESNLSFSFNASPKQVPTEFAKLDVKFRFPPPSISKRQWKLHFYD